jgi:hypothetical protein
MRPAITHLATFGFVVAWEWAVAMGVRFTADESAFAPLFAMLLAAIWWVAVGVAARKPGLIYACVLGAGAGNWLGISWP